MTSFITTMSVQSFLPPREVYVHSLPHLRQASPMVINASEGLYPFPRPPCAVYHSPLLDGFRSSVCSPGLSSSNARTRGPFKPRNANKGTSSYQLRQFAEATLGSGSLRKAVRLPEGEDLNEWLAVNGQ